MDNKKVSIIIPAYNVEKYIKKGIESAINQTYRNIEVLVVDDGSEDDTLRIAIGYQYDERVKVFHQSNKGVSAARNLALSMSSGEYVIFLDSDDWLEECAVEKLIEIAEYNGDYMPAVGRTIRYDYCEEILRVHTDVVVRIDSERALLDVGMGKFSLQSSCYKLFDLNVIRKYNLFFNSNFHHGEDGLFVFEYLKRTNGIAYMDIPLWNILVRDNSATCSPFNEKWLSALDAVQVMIDYDNSEELDKYLKAYMAKRAIALAWISMQKRESSDKKTVKELYNIAKKYKKQFLTVYGNKERIQYLIVLCVPYCIQKNIFPIYYS